MMNMGRMESLSESKESTAMGEMVLKCFNKFSKALAVICLVCTEDAVETFLAVIRDPCKLATVII